MTDLESGDRRDRGEVVLLSHLCCKTDGSWGEYLRVHAYIFYDTDIRGGYNGTRITWVWRGYIISHMITGPMETVGFKGSLIFEIWIDIQGCGRIDMVALKIYGKDLEWSINRNQKVFLDEAQLICSWKQN